jgi:hypothetical protein
VLFVNKRLAVVDPAGKPAGVHPLDAKNIPFSAPARRARSNADDGWPIRQAVSDR